MARDSRHDVVIVGGGHNGLVAAAYLARAGRSVLVLERRDHVGGAAVSERPWPGVDARLSRYAYLVSLLPHRIVDELGLQVRLGRRRISSYTPLPADPARGVLVDAEDRERTAASLGAAVGDPAAIEGWERLYATCARAARALWPTMTEPLRPAAELRALVGDDAAWAALVERPIGELIEDCLGDDALRGIALTDALIGTFAGAHDVDLRQNRCFLYHVIGNGSGHWDVPMGGMGAITAELEAAARAGGAELRRRRGDGDRCGARGRRGALRRRRRWRRAGGGRRARAGQRRPRGARSPARSRVVGRDARGRPAEGQPPARPPAPAARPRRGSGRRLRRHLSRQRGLRAARARSRAGRGRRPARRRAVRDLLPLAHRPEHPRA